MNIEVQDECKPCSNRTGAMCQLKLCGLSYCHMLPFILWEHKQHASIIKLNKRCPLRIFFFLLNIQEMAVNILWMFDLHLTVIVGKLFSKTVSAELSNHQIIYNHQRYCVVTTVHFGAKAVQARSVWSHNTVGHRRHYCSCV